MTGLVERLREDQNDHPEDDTWIEDLFRQAADRIEQLEADNIGLNIALDKCIDLGSYEIAQARIKELEGAISSMIVSSSLGDMYEIARAALKVEP